MSLYTWMRGKPEKKSLYAWMYNNPSLYYNDTIDFSNPRPTHYPAFSGGPTFVTYQV